MRVVSGLTREHVHFEAPSAERVENEMKKFLDFFNGEYSIDGILKTGIAHFWFVTIHPFEDGNGRVARTIADMLLVRAENSHERFYSMSAQIEKERSSYYEILEAQQKKSKEPKMRYYSVVGMVSRLPRKGYRKFGRGSLVGHAKISFLASCKFLFAE